MSQGLYFSTDRCLVERCFQRGRFFCLIKFCWRALPPLFLLFSFLHFSLKKRGQKRPKTGSTGIGSSVGRCSMSCSIATMGTQCCEPTYSKLWATVQRIRFMQKIHSKMTPHSLYTQFPLTEITYAKFCIWCTFGHTGHGRRDILHKHINEQYANVTKGHISVYLDFCETCNLKKSKIKKSLVVKPIISKDFNSWAQVIFKWSLQIELIFNSSSDCPRIWSDSAVAIEGRPDQTQQ